jgi:periplasmic divalent cation tolerance protein
MYNSGMTRFIQIATTTATKAEADQIAAMLVEQQLVACAQVSGPLASVYHWQGQVESNAEWLCTLKTRETLFERVAAAIREVHSYQCPEIIATPIVAGSADYLAWLERETTGDVA